MKLTWADNSSEAAALVEAVSDFARQGWTPATSSNFSIRLNLKPLECLITQSGRDKTRLTHADLMRMDENLMALEPHGARPSAEGYLHVQIYKELRAGCVLHTHSLTANAMSLLASHDRIEFENLELLKAFPGDPTHKQKRFLFIVDNSQEMREIWAQVEGDVAKPESLPGFLVRGHGIYAWGENVFAAKRHLEALEYLLSLKWALECRSK